VPLAALADAAATVPPDEALKQVRPPTAPQRQPPGLSAAVQAAAALVAGEPEKAAAAAAAAIRSGVPGVAGAALVVVAGAALLLGRYADVAMTAAAGSDSGTLAEPVRRRAATAACVLTAVRQALLAARGMAWYLLGNPQLAVHDLRAAARLPTGPVVRHPRVRSDASSTS
jgi:hypothetical protein